MKARSDEERVRRGIQLYDADFRPILRGQAREHSEQRLLERAAGEARRLAEDACIEGVTFGLVSNWCALDGAILEGISIIDLMRVLAEMDGTVPRHRGVEHWLGEYDAYVHHARQALARLGWHRSWRTVNGRHRPFYLNPKWKQAPIGAMRQQKVAASPQSNPARGGHVKRLRANGGTLARTVDSPVGIV